MRAIASRWTRRWNNQSFCILRTFGVCPRYALPLTATVVQICSCSAVLLARLMNFTKYVATKGYQRISAAAKEGAKHIETDRQITSQKSCFPSPHCAESAQTNTYIYTNS
ncbi:uncharacterized protein LOC118746202 isoform X1 [Rhagoletis pomonella]|uniref:uncharacterized protein LOC118746202 isoform X1 n=1 Tax=Rhagoletis pomonella TaxID=28610 RepID=UPI0017860B10|nr:uncharacterized protein LOC118746202 isoform X1 [Rhagoletis pomonella]